VDTREIGQEFRPMLRLAAPLALTELGWLAMAFTDTVMVGRLPDSATAIGAVSLGSTLFYTVGIFGSGIMLGMDTLVARLMARAGWTSAIAPCGTQSIWHASCRPF
jgi:MATE family multidrug resistance protein